MTVTVLNKSKARYFPRERGIIDVSTKSRKTVGKIQSETNAGNDACGSAAVSVFDPVAETQSEIRMTYQTYLESQKALLSAVKEQERKGASAFKVTDMRYRAYEEIIDKAFKNREILDNQALETYRNKVEKAAGEYKETIKRSLQYCQQITDEAWQASIRACYPTRSSLANRLRRYLTQTVKNIRTRLGVAYKRMRILAVTRISL